MKFIYALVLLAVSATTAEACNHSRQQFICPGDKVVDRYNRIGQVTAVNPFQKTAAYNIVGGFTASADITTLSLGVGCLEAFCVGDRIVDRYNRNGVVIAVNPYQSSVAYSLVGGFIASADVSTLLVGYGCNMSYCVGDDIVDRYNRPGRIVALSPYEDSAAYSMVGGFIAAAELQTLSNSRFCEEYGDEHRAMVRYPELPSRRYAAPDFRWYSKR